jgi:hypothetical protein
MSFCIHLSVGTSRALVTSQLIYIRRRAVADWIASDADMDR